MSATPAKPAAAADPAAKPPTAPSPRERDPYARSWVSQSFADPAVEADFRRNDYELDVTFKHVANVFLSAGGIIVDVVWAFTRSELPFFSVTATISALYIFSTLICIGWMLAEMLRLRRGAVATTRRHIVTTAVIVNVSFTLALAMINSANVECVSTGRLDVSYSGCMWWLTTEYSRTTVTAIIAVGPLLLTFSNSGPWWVAVVQAAVHQSIYIAAADIVMWQQMPGDVWALVQMTLFWGFSTIVLSISAYQFERSRRTMFVSQCQLSRTVHELGRARDALHREHRRRVRFAEEHRAFRALSSYIGHEMSNALLIVRSALWEAQQEAQARQVAQQAAVALLTGPPRHPASPPRLLEHALSQQHPRQQQQLLQLEPFHPGSQQVVLQPPPLPPQEQQLQHGGAPPVLPLPLLPVLSVDGVASPGEHQHAHTHALALDGAAPLHDDADCRGRASGSGCGGACCSGADGRDRCCSGCNCSGECTESACAPMTIAAAAGGGGAVAVVPPPAAEDSAYALESLSAALRAADDMARILRDTTDLALLRDGHMALHREPTDLRPTLSLLCRTATATSGLPVRLSVDPSLPAVMLVDPVRLRQIVQNGLDTALALSDAALAAQGGTGRGAALPAIAVAVVVEAVPLRSTSVPASGSLTSVGVRAFSSSAADVAGEVAAAGGAAPLPPTPLQRRSSAASVYPVAAAASASSSSLGGNVNQPPPQAAGAGGSPARSPSPAALSSQPPQQQPAPSLYLRIRVFSFGVTLPERPEYLRAVFGGHAHSRLELADEQQPLPGRGTGSAMAISALDGGNVLDYDDVAGGPAATAALSAAVALPPSRPAWQQPFISPEDGVASVLFDEYAISTLRNDHARMRAQQQSQISSAKPTPAARPGEPSEPSEAGSIGCASDGFRQFRRRPSLTTSDGSGSAPPAAEPSSSAAAAAALPRDSVAVAVLSAVPAAQPPQQKLPPRQQQQQSEQHHQHLPSHVLRSMPPKASSLPLPSLRHVTDGDDGPTAIAGGDDDAAGSLGVNTHSHLTRVDLAQAEVETLSRALLGAWRMQSSPSHGRSSRPPSPTSHQPAARRRPSIGSGDAPGLAEAAGTAVATVDAATALLSGSRRTLTQLRKQYHMQTISFWDDKDGSGSSDAGSNVDGVAGGLRGLFGAVASPTKPAATAALPAAAPPPQLPFCAPIAGTPPAVQTTVYLPDTLASSVLTAVAAPGGGGGPAPAVMVTPTCVLETVPVVGTRAHSSVPLTSPKPAAVAAALQPSPSNAALTHALQPLVQPPPGEADVLSILRSSLNRGIGYGLPVLGRLVDLCGGAVALYNRSDDVSGTVLDVLLPTSPAGIISSGSGSSAAPMASSPAVVAGTMRRVPSTATAVDGAPALTRPPSLARSPSSASLATGVSVAPSVTSSSATVDKPPRPLGAVGLPPTGHRGSVGTPAGGASPQLSSTASAPLGPAYLTPLSSVIERSVGWSPGRTAAATTASAAPAAASPTPSLSGAGTALAAAGNGATGGRDRSGSGDSTVSSAVSLSATSAVSGAVGGAAALGRQAALRAAAAAAGGGSRPRRALVVDDENVNRRLLVRMLQRLGVAADTCADGSEVLPRLLATSPAPPPGISLAPDGTLLLVVDNKAGGSSAGAGTGVATLAGGGGRAASAMAAPAPPFSFPVAYDFILMDIRMQAMHGVAACREARVAGVGVPIIAVTGNVDSVDVAEYRAAGFDGLLSKPFSFEQLSTCVSAAVAESAAAAAAAGFGGVAGVTAAPLPPPLLQVGSGGSRSGGSIGGAPGADSPVTSLLQDGAGAASAGAAPLPWSLSQAPSLY